MIASVIIPSLNAPVVDRAVAAVRAGTRQPSEIIVVGRDDPGRLVGDSGVRFVRTERVELPGGARNLGASIAGGDVLVFLDADCVPEAEWLAAHLDRHEQGRTIVGGAVRWDDDNYWSLSDNLSMFHECDVAAPRGPRAYLPTLNLSVRTQVFDDAGPMDPHLPRGEDLDWTIRAAARGHEPWFEPAARVWHRPDRTTPGRMWAHWYESGRWLVAVRRRHPQVFGDRTWWYRPMVLRMMFPAIALVATARLYAVGQPGRRHPATWPAVYATKVAWCLGAARPALVE